MTISTDGDLGKPTATLKEILDGADNLPTELQLDDKGREILSAYLDAFEVTESEDSPFQSLRIFTNDPTYTGFVRGYKGEEKKHKSGEPHILASRIGYAAGQEARDSR